MAINRTSPKKGKVVDIPTVPTIGVATADAESATVAYTAATVGGPATTFTALSNPGSITGTGSSSPITVSGLTAGTAYTFTLRGNNATGSSEYSSVSNSVTPFVAPAFESIATYAITTGTPSVTFSSIPQTYKHLQIRYFARFNLVNDTGSPSFRFNGDAGANYTFHQLYGDGTTAGSGGAASQNQLAGAQIASENKAANIFGAGTIDIFDYTSTSKYKTMKSFGGWDANGSALVNLRSGVWMNTSAITSINIFPTASGAWMNYSHFALYGIKG